ncbi:MAG: hypothetical protein HDR18_14545 [Lachnospiraceae bacterium]|nr:hypothetical protein [Lachnospiraceae bacterium]
MRKKLKFGSPKLTAALFILAGVLLFGSSIGGASAALTYFSESYRSQVEMYDIGVTLNENGKGIANRDYQSYSDGKWEEGVGVLLENRWSDENPLQLGKAYEEAVSVTNSGSIDQYVRVSLYKYWVKNGEKQQNLDPGLIELNLANAGSGWIIDTSASTAERTVLYYNRILGVGETSVPATDTLTISAKVLDAEEQYNGAEFRIEAEVDAVQTHNAEDAIWSAWGREIHVNNGSLSLN